MPTGFLNIKTDYVVVEVGRPFVEEDGDKTAVDWAVCIGNSGAGEAVDYHPTVLDAIKAGKALAEAKQIPFLMGDSAVDEIEAQLDVLDNLTVVVGVEGGVITGASALAEGLLIVIDHGNPADDAIHYIVDDATFVAESADRVAALGV